MDSEPNTDNSRKARDEAILFTSVAVTGFMTALTVGDFSPKVFFPALAVLGLVVGGITVRLAKQRPKSGCQNHSPTL
jgi:hypothetical protein